MPPFVRSTCAGALSTGRSIVGRALLRMHSLSAGSAVHAGEVIGREPHERVRRVRRINSNIISACCPALTVVTDGRAEMTPLGAAAAPAALIMLRAARTHGK